MKKIIEYKDLIGKNIKSIEEDGLQVRINFTDNTYADIVGHYGGFVGLCTFNEDKKDNIIEATIHE